MWYALLTPAMKNSRELDCRASTRPQALQLRDVDANVNVIYVFVVVETKKAAMHEDFTLFNSRTALPNELSMRPSSASVIPWYSLQVALQ